MDGYPWMLARHDIATPNSPYVRDLRPSHTSRGPRRRQMETMAAQQAEIEARRETLAQARCVCVCMCVCVCLYSARVFSQRLATRECVCVYVCVFYSPLTSACLELLISPISTHQASVHLYGFSSRSHPYRRTSFSQGRTHGRPPAPR